LIGISAIFLVEIGIVKVPLLFCDLRPAVWQSSWAVFQRIVFVELILRFAPPEGRASLGVLGGFDRGGLHRGSRFKSAPRCAACRMPPAYSTSGRRPRRDHRGHHAIEKIGSSADQDTVPS